MKLSLASSSTSSSSSATLLSHNIPFLWSVPQTQSFLPHTHSHTSKGESNAFNNIKRTCVPSFCASFVPHSHADTHTHTHTHTRIRTYTRTHIHTHTRTRTHAHTHTRTHARTHAHTQGATLRGQTSAAQTFLARTYRGRHTRELPWTPARASKISRGQSLSLTLAPSRYRY